ncbi:MAG: Phosphoglycerate mutase [Candidatus Sulfotelmatobacter sp.]|nr:Phosphoglycerate mutase [Candidatus Sulfotelmatobacter sp.]
MDLKNTLLFAARHGTTVLNEKGCFRGPLNPPLDEKGKRDAEELGKFFQDIPIACIISSDKTRALQTAHTIAKYKPGIEIYPNSGLHALNVGNFAGKPKDENEDEFEYYVQNPDVTIPGGESLNGFKARVRPLLAEGVKLSNQIGKPVLFTIHSSIIHEMGSMINNDHESTLVKPGGAARIYYGNGNLKAEPILKPDFQSGRSGADKIS